MAHQHQADPIPLHHGQQPGQSGTQSASTKEPEKIEIGPRPYNRFLGNPPPGVTPAEAFKAENGYDWLEEIFLAEVRAKVESLEVKNNELEVENNKLMAQVGILQQQLASAQATHSTSATSTGHLGNPNPPVKQQGHL